MINLSINLILSIIFSFCVLEIIIRQSSSASICNRPRPITFRGFAAPIYFVMCYPVPFYSTGDARYRMLIP